MSTRMLSLGRPAEEAETLQPWRDGVSGAERSRRTLPGLAPHSPCFLSPGTDSGLCISHLGGSCKEGQVWEGSRKCSAPGKLQGLSAVRPNSRWGGGGGGEGLLGQWGPSHDPSCHFLQGLGLTLTL